MIMQGLSTEKMQLIMLPSDEPTNLGLLPNDVLKYLKKSSLKKLGIGKFQHLYLVSGKEIKEGDFGIGFATGIKGVGKGYFLFKNDRTPKGKLLAIAKGSMKIEATTNLLSDIRPTENGLGVIVPNPIPKIHQSFVEEFAKSGGSIKEVGVEVYGWKDCPDHLKVHTMSESLWGEKHIGKIKTRTDNSVIIHHNGKVY